MNLNQIENVLQFGQTRRFHTEVTLRSQDVAQHVYNLLWLVRLLHDSNDDGVVMSPTMMYAIMEHDAGERRTGDMPSPFRRYMGTSFEANLDMEERLHVSGLVSPPDLPPLTTDEEKLLHFCDKAEAALFLLRDAQLGNRLPATKKMLAGSISTLAILSTNDAQTKLVREIDREFGRLFN